MRKFVNILIIYLLLSLFTFLILYKIDEIVGWYLITMIYPLFFSFIFLVRSLIKLIKKEYQDSVDRMLIAIMFSVLIWQISFVYFNIFIYAIFCILISIRMIKHYKNNRSLKKIQKKILIPLMFITLIVQLVGIENVYRLHRPDLNYWRPYCLTFNDFVITDTIPNPVHANEDARISTQYRRIVNRAYNPNSIMILSAQIPDNSYMLERKDYILNHEQLHFDIRELYCRKIKKSINNNWYKDYYIKSLIFDSFNLELKQFQDKYDSTVFFSEESVIEQERWNKKIREELGI